ncbi:MAG: histidine phosphatase family protein [Balneolaceae bacterium]|nr:histidine phosphatase family protein [Balneolaceae bacterium]
MKYILLLRHAKSSHEDSSLKDFDRPLAPRGNKDASGMGGFLRKIDYLPGSIISSPAERAGQTTKLLLHGAELNEDIVQWNEELYYGSSRDYLRAIQKADDKTDTALVVGHNPKIEDIARRLCGNGSVRMPTAAIVCLEQPAKEWSQIREGLASLKWMMIPKILNKLAS